MPPVVSNVGPHDNPGMSEEWVREYWALLGAGAALLAVLVVVFIAAVRRSRRGRLARLARQQQKERKAFDAAVAAYKRSVRRLEQLEKKQNRVAPRALDEARDAVTDAKQLVEIRKGALQVADNHVRMIIVEEFPPGRHEALRRRYGVSGHPDNRPFTFDGS